MSPELAVVTLAEHLCAQPAACGDAEPIYLALAAAIEEAASYRTRPTPRRVREMDEGRSMPVDERAQGLRRAEQYRPEACVGSELLSQCLEGKL